MSERGVSFVIRLWLESDRDRLPPEWRWKVFHAQNGHERQGRCFDDLMAFVAEESGVPPPGRPRRTAPRARTTAAGPAAEHAPEFGPQEG